MSGIFIFQCIMLVLTVPCVAWLVREIFLLRRSTRLLKTEIRQMDKLLVPLKKEKAEGLRKKAVIEAWRSR